MNMPEEISKRTATTNLLQSFSAQKSRRSLLKGAAVSAAGVATLAGTGLFLSSKNSAHASGSTEGPEDSIVQILSIAATAEQLAIAFYHQGIIHAGKMNITGANLDYLLAAIIEEQIHRDFLVAAGGKPLTDTFSFPKGEDTFDDVKKFVATLEQLEEAFIAAYLAAVKEFAMYGQPGLAQIAAQIMGVEAEHRGLGRSINPDIMFADNFAFEPALVESVGDAVGYLQASGYLSPKKDNSYTYHRVSTDNSNVIQRTPYTAPEDKD